MLADRKDIEQWALEEAAHIVSGRFHRIGRVPSERERGITRDIAQALQSAYARGMEDAAKIAESRPYSHIGIASAIRAAIKKEPNAQP